MPLIFYAQTITITGTVSDITTETPLPGVSIVVKGTVNGTSTDFDGKYSLEANTGDILVFTFIGYIIIEKEVTSNVLDVSLEEDEEQLDEVVIIGYGTTTVKDATGSLTAVTSADFNKGAIVTPENLLTGKVAGLTIVTGGEPGAGSVIRIRGGSSLGASNDPLIVIDGLPIDNNTIGGSRSVLSSINPNDIDSFTVLKDASATAIYGSRAANGVIIISLKKGSKKFVVDYNVQVGVSSLTDTTDNFSADEFRELVAEKRPDLVSKLGEANTNWQDEIYQTGVSTVQNLSVQGSLLDAVPTRFSIGRTDQEGIRLTSEFERNSASLSLNPSLFKDHLKVKFNANMSAEKNRFASGQEGNALRFDPTQPVYDENSPFGGFFQYYEDNNDGVIDENDLISLAPFNPVAELLQRNSISDVNRYYGNIKLDYNLHFFPDLTAVVNIGYDEQTAEGSVNVSDQNPLSQSDGSIIGSSSNYTNKQKNTLFDGYLSYNKVFDEFVLDATAGYSYQKFENNRYNSNELLNDNEDSEPVFNIDPDLVLIGLFARANLSLKDKYLFTLSYRRDGTSRFSENNRWGNFPAAAFAWKMNEDLFKDVDELSTLKLRASWGITGQQDIGNNNLDLYMSRYIRGLPASQYIFGGQTIPIGIPQFRNEDLKWEETTTYNAGLDFGFDNDRFTGTIEAYYKESKDLLANAAISEGSNFSNSGFQNIGNFTSKGLEFAFNADIIRDHEDLNWNVSFNTSFIKTEIKTLALDQDQLVGGIGGGTGGLIQIHRVGYTPYTFYVYKQIYNAAGDPIEGGYADLNGDNIINSDDRYLHRNGAPTVTMGFQSNLSYKNFDLSFNLRSSIGNHVYNNVNSTAAQYNLIENSSVLSNLSTSVLESGFNRTEDVILSDYFIENASFLKMDNITLGYNFNNIIKSKDRLNLRLTAGIQNAFVLTSYSGLDPEVFNNGIDNTIYPRPRTYLFGANITF